MSSLIADREPQTEPYLTDTVKQHLAKRLELLRTGRDSDLTVRCGTAEWRVHGSVLSSLSRYFAAACNGDFKEAHSGIIELKDEDPDTIERMLIYLNVEDYPVGAKTANSTCDVGKDTLSPLKLHTDPDAEARNQEEQSQDITTQQTSSTSTTEVGTRLPDCLVVHAQVYVLADRLAIPDLKELANQRFLKRIESQPWLPSGFEDAALEIIRSTPTSDNLLRGTITKLCAQYFTEQRMDEAGSETKKISSNGWIAVLKEDSDFTWDILVQMAKSYRNFRAGYADRLKVLLEKRCSYCHEGLELVVEEDADNDNLPFLNVSSCCERCYIKTLPPH